MPLKKDAKTTENTEKQEDYLQIKLPSLKRSSVNPILLFLLLVASFLLGMLFTKVQYLEQSKKDQTNQPVVTGAANQPVAQKPAGNIKPVTNKDHIRGNQNAKVTLVEYSDLECPFCKQFHPTMKQLLTTYGNKIRWVYRHFPLPFHQNAQKEAEASECVAELGGNDAFWNYVDKIFERTTSNGTGFALDQLGPLASEVGVSQQAFQTCLDSGKYAQLVKDEEADDQQAGVTGTPSTFIVNSKGQSQLIVGAQPLDAFKTAIDQALKQ